MSPPTALSSPTPDLLMRARDSAVDLELTPALLPEGTRVWRYREHADYYGFFSQYCYNIIYFVCPLLSGFVLAQYDSRDWEERPVIQYLIWSVYFGSYTCLGVANVFISVWIKTPLTRNPIVHSHFGLWMPLIMAFLYSGSIVLGLIILKKTDLSEWERKLAKFFKGCACAMFSYTLFVFFLAAVHRIMYWRDVRKVYWNNVGFNSTATWRWWEVSKAVRQALVGSESPQRRNSTVYCYPDGTTEIQDDGTPLALAVHEAAVVASKKRGEERKKEEKNERREEKEKKKEETRKEKKIKDEEKDPSTTITAVPAAVLRDSVR